MIISLQRIRRIFFGITLMSLLSVSSCAPPVGTEDLTGQEDSETGNDEDPDQDDEENNSEETDDEETGRSNLVPGQLKYRIGDLSPEEGLYPDFSVITRYVLDFIDQDGIIVENRELGPGEEDTITLDAGDWEIRVYGLLDGKDGTPPQKITEYLVKVTIPEDGELNTVITPKPAAATGPEGYFSWGITFPGDEIRTALLELSVQDDTGGFIPYQSFDLTQNGRDKQKISLPKGVYRMELRLLARYSWAGTTEILHIFPGLETKSPEYSFTGKDFPEVLEFSSVEEVKPYLDSLPGNTEADPYPVKIGGVDMSSKENSGATMRTLYAALSRYVSLDLRDGTGDRLIAASSANIANRVNVVSLILPNTITVVEPNGFSGYSALKSAVMPSVVTLDYAAFKDLKNLASVSGPELRTIIDVTENPSAAKGSFYRCTALKELDFPKLETIGKYTFYGCEALTALSFPQASMVGQFACKGCTALRTVELPKAALIDKEAFNNDTALEQLVLGAVPPET
ncbi:MAG: leucine-rich repeat domain-containing protein, partial [Treponema sp.]|nr:leucine-rich repeat domain-containing protein [Treponema sp.]